MRSKTSRKLKNKPEKTNKSAGNQKHSRAEKIGRNQELKKTTSVRRVNVDFPVWMIQALDREALKLNISRQAVIKTWLGDRLNHQRGA